MLGSFVFARRCHFFAYDREIISSRSLGRISALACNADTRLKTDIELLGRENTRRQRTLVEKGCAFGEENLRIYVYIIIYIHIYIVVIGLVWN